jgi:molecular chaperone DnaK
MSKILGIDLGTTNSAFAVYEDDSPRILENAEGNRTTPSMVALSKNDERLVGQPAKRQAVTNPDNTIHGIKRLIGHNFDEEAVQEQKEVASYEITEGDDGGVMVTMGEKKYRPEQISAMILSKIKQDAEEKLGEEIEEAVITVPAYFSDSQRQATKDAGEIAGLDVKRIINEPTAAALAYGFKDDQEKKIAVYDFGGGTFDISVIETGEGVVEVQSSLGDSHMGGADFDAAIIDWIIEEFKNDTGIDISDDRLALQRLDEAAEEAKIELSNTEETEINIPFLTSTDEGPEHLQLKLTRAKLEQLVEEYIDRSLDITEKAVNESPFSKDEIDEVILVGGQTRMPKISERVEDFFGKSPNKSINPDEVVALGAAVQSGIFQDDVQDVLLLDVTPLSLGIETMGGVFTEIIKANTTIPTSRSKTFSTAEDNQTSVEIKVLQGERAMADDNQMLGRFILDGIPPAARGTPKIDVTFDIDADGILNVSAEDQETGKEQSIKIEATSDLSEDEIEEMKEEAEKHKEEDEKKKQRAKKRNQADQLIHTAEEAIDENEEAIDDSIIADIEEKIDAVKDAKEEEDMDTLDQATENLSDAMQEIGEAMQKQAAETEEQETNDTDSNEDVRDAEVEDDEGEDDAQQDE